MIPHNEIILLILIILFFITIQIPWFHSNLFLNESTFSFQKLGQLSFLWSALENILFFSIFYASTGLICHQVFLPKMFWLFDKLLLSEWTVLFYRDFMNF